MKGKKIVAAVVAVAIVLAALYAVAPGFSKLGNVYIADYAVSDDGTKMTVTVAVASSMGYVRKLSERQQRDSVLEIDCYAAFGGINGNWGAKSEHTIRLLRDTEVIAIYRSADRYEPALEKDENGNWQCAEAE